VAARKKILLVSNEASYTGAPIFLFKLLKHLQDASLQYEVEIFFCDGGSLVEKFESLGCKVYVSGKRSVSGASWRRLINRIGHHFFFWKTVAKSRPDLIYSNTMVNFGEVTISRLFGVPTILHVHEGKKFADTFSHRLRIACFCASRIVAGSNYAKSCFLKYSSKVILVIYNGVSLQPIPLALERTRNVPIKIGMLGSIDPNKGQHLLLEAAEILLQRGVDFKIEIVGEAVNEGYCKKIETLAAGAISEKVSTQAFVDDSIAFVRSLDILVVASYEEVLPTVILEALSVRTIVVASRTGGIPEIIRDNETGFLFETGKSADLAMVLERIVHISNDKVSKILDEGLITIETNFDVKKTNESLETLIEKTLNGL
jgi:glycosyltransferase involved in cell wall biosynthesis